MGHDGGVSSGPADIDRARVVLGVGASRGCPSAELAELVDAALTEAGLERADVAAVASADIKADEPAILELAAALGVPARFLPAEVLKAVTVPTPSAVVAAHVGTPSVSEAAALIVAAEGGAVRAAPAPPADHTGSDAPPAGEADADASPAGEADPGASSHDDAPHHDAASRARLLVTKRRSARATCAIAAPTHDAPPRRIVTATDDCRGCGGCVRTCPEHALVPVGAPRADGTFATALAGGVGGVPLLTLADRCTGCGECLEICPVDAFIEVLLP
jgi:cobalt-precorrin 5A hydrolase/cobalt-precorrin 5A hydrolase/precorrin-3B C17-methyltransferase